MSRCKVGLHDVQTCTTTDDRPEGRKHTCRLQSWCNPLAADVTNKVPARSPSVHVSISDNAAKLVNSSTDARDRLSNICTNTSSPGKKVLTPSSTASLRSPCLGISLGKCICVPGTAAMSCVAIFRCIASRVAVQG